MNQIKKSTVTPDEALKPSYIEDTLKFVESEEMRKALFEWLMQHSVPDYCCIDIIRHSPMPFKQKLDLSESFGKYKGTEYLDELGYMFLFVMGDLEECYAKSKVNNPTGTEYRLYMYDQPKDTYKQFTSFEEAVEHIKQVRAQTDGASESDNFGSHEFGRTNIIEKWIPAIRGEKLEIYLLLNDAGDILYYDRSADAIRRVPGTIPGRLSFYVPFKPGSIVVADCSPFAPAKKVVILENNDTLECADSYGVTCLFINDYGNIDVGYFKSNEFLKQPKQTYVSVMYRAKTYTGELTEAESPLGIISNFIKEKPELGHKIYRYVDKLQIYSDAIARTLSRDYVGASWKRMKKEFGLLDIYTPIMDMTNSANDKTGTADTETTD